MIDLLYAFPPSPPISPSFLPSATHDNLLQLHLLITACLLVSIVGLGSDEQVQIANDWQEQGKLGCFSLTEKFAGVNR